MDKYKKAAENIINAQMMIIGPVAYDLARQVNGLYAQNSKEVEIDGDPKLILTDLISTYQQLFGNVSVNVSKDAINDLRGTFGDDELPSLLR
jgi:hypothetical protein